MKLLFVELFVLMVADIGVICLSTLIRFFIKLHLHAQQM